MNVHASPLLYGAVSAPVYWVLSRVLWLWDELWRAAVVRALSRTFVSGESAV